MIFQTTLSQMVFLFSLLAIGYLLAKMKLVPDNTEAVLSRLESDLLIPALVMDTFIHHFTVEKLMATSDLLLGSILIEIIVIPVSMVLVRFCAKDKYTRNIYLYGLCFSNFGFMGNAIISMIFPDVFLEYLLFTMILWIVIYIWGAPVLLMDHGLGSWKETCKTFLNPMFVSMLVGMALGLSGVAVPKFADQLVASLGDCMSPLAMLLTGMTVARSKLSEILKHKSIYVITAIRLLIYPLIFIAIAQVVPMSRAFSICALSSLAMPLGLNTIVIPNAYGKDTKIAAGMALVSHLFSCLTIPIVFFLLLPS